MATDLPRRSLLKWLPAGIALGALPASVFASVNSRFYAAASSGSHQHFLCAWANGHMLYQVPSPSRGHDVVVNKARNCAIYFARRPGNWLIALDANSGKKLTEVRSETGRHFYGHGALSSDGRYLFTAENAFNEGGRGVIGIYDCADSFKRLGEYDSGGIGPHQIARLPNTNTLVVANGGILTLPDTPREKLNIDTMQPSLCYLDADSGKLLGEWQPPHHQLSLRHLDVADDGRVTVGAQFEGPSGLTLPLLFSHRGEQQLLPYDATESVWRAHNHYIASVACAEGRVLATSPRGNCISLWHRGKLVQQQRLKDVAGAAYDISRQQFITSNGLGQFVGLTANKLQLTGRVAGLHWDNHMSISG